MIELGEDKIHKKWQTVSYYRNIFDRMHHKILNTINIDEKIQILKEAYAVFKESSYIYYQDQEAFEFLLQDIYGLNHSLELVNPYYICDTEINLELNPLICKHNSPEHFLDYIVFNCRDYLQSKLKKDELFESINDSDLINYCKCACDKIQKECYNHGYKVKCETVRINPGFTKGSIIKHSYKCHYFCIISLDNKKYLVDCTYKQFFLKTFNISECIELVGYAGCHPGFYMLEDSYRKQIAMQILKRGWVEITEESFKAYMDGFSLSFRNGLYYEDIGYIDYNTKYEAQDYCRFLLGKDLLLNYEKEEHLGLQKRPLFNNSLDFTSK